MIDAACRGGACACARGTMRCSCACRGGSTRHRCRHGGTSVGGCTATQHAELRQCASGAEPQVVASGAGLGAEPSAEPGAKPRARPRGQCSVVRVCSSITSTIFKLVTDTPFFIKTGTKSLGEPAQLLTTYSITKKTSLFSSLWLEYFYFTPNCGCPRPSVVSIILRTCSRGVWEGGASMHIRRGVNRRCKKA